MCVSKSVALALPRFATDRAAIAICIADRQSWHAWLLGRVAPDVFCNSFKQSSGLGNGRTSTYVIHVYHAESGPGLESHTWITYAMRAAGVIFYSSRGELTRRISPSQPSGEVCPANITAAHNEKRRLVRRRFACSARASWRPVFEHENPAGGKPPKRAPCPSYDHFRFGSRLCHSVDCS
jgi:hypothetical protein